MIFSNLLNALTSPSDQINSLPGLEPVYPNAPAPPPVAVDSILFIIITVVCAVAIKFVYSKAKRSNQVPQE